MKQKAIPAPILGPHPRKYKPDLKPLHPVSIPRPPSEPESRGPERNPAQTKPAPADKAPEKPIPASEAKLFSGLKMKKQALGPLPEPPPIAVLDDGTKIPLPFKPVDPLSALNSMNPTVAFVMLRQLQDMQGEMPDTSSGALKVIEKLASALKNKKDLTAITEEVSTYIAGDDALNELRFRLHDSHDWERSDEIDKSRAKWESFCHGCMRRSDLTVTEGMAVMAYLDAQQEKIFNRIDKRRLKVESTGQRESQELLQRVNRPLMEESRALERKFNEAPPQEREILRKIGFKLESALAARITTTKETQTVEIVQPNDG